MDVEARIDAIEKMVREIHDVLCLASKRPTYEQALAALVRGDTTILDQYLQAGGRIPAGAPHAGAGS